MEVAQAEASAMFAAAKEASVTGGVTIDNSPE